VFSRCKAKNTIILLGHFIAKNHVVIKTQQITGYGFPITSLCV